MKKGVKYFFNLWGRNFLGHFRILGNLAKTLVPIGALLAIIVGAPVIALSPITSLIKTVVDYRSRKLPSEDKLVQLKGQGNSIDERIDALSEGAVRALVQVALEYKSKNMSRATRDLQTYLILHSNVIPDSIDEVKRKFMLYLADPKNVAKGFYNLVVEQVLKQSNVQATMPGAGTKQFGGNPYTSPAMQGSTVAPSQTSQDENVHLAWKPIDPKKLAKERDELFKKQMKAPEEQAKNQQAQIKAAAKSKPQPSELAEDTLFTQTSTF